MTDLWVPMNVKELVDGYDLLTVEPTHVVAAPKKFAGVDARQIDQSELGSSGATQYGNYLTDEYNAKLRGENGLRVYDEMRRSDGQTYSTLRLIKTPVIAARWYMEPASQSDQDIKVAEFVWECLTRRMTVSWPQLLTEILTFVDFGWYAFEKVFTIDERGRALWKKWAPRHPMHSQGWEYDANGGPKLCRFYSDDKYGEGTPIPIEKLLTFTLDKESGNMEGRSALRPAYKHWYFKENLYKIDAIQKERHGIGIPVIKLPPSWTPADRAAADSLGRNIRTNEKAHITLPPFWEIAMLKMEGQPVDCLPSIEHHNAQIRGTILGEFAMEKDGDLFLKSARFVADIVRDVINKWAIPELVDYNWLTVDEYPELRVRRLGDTIDWRTYSFAMRNLVGAGIVKPDDKLEEFFREEMDAPKRDIETVREVATPQAPKAAPPRQSTAAGMKQQAQGTGKSNVGQDGSGD